MGSTQVFFNRWISLDQAWQQISMDFIEGLPKSAGYEVNLVTIDRLIKYAHFIALNNHYSAQKVAQECYDI